MLKLSPDFARTIITHPEAPTSLGYVCEYGGIVGDAEFILWEEGNDFYLVHKSEIESNGVLLKLKKEN
jgi:hypothetical protein